MCAGEGELDVWFLGTRRWIMRICKSAAIFAAACLAVAPMASAAMTYTFQDGDSNGYAGTQDITIYGGSDSQVNTGGSSVFYLGYSAKSLLRFDDLGVLAGQTVQSATVTLYTSSNSYGTHSGDPATDPVTLYAMDNANVGWQQGTGSYPDAATSGEACFDYLSFNTTPWPSPTSVQNWTTDGVATVLDTQTFTYQTDGVPVTFTLPVALVQQWVNGGAHPGLIVDSSTYINGVQFQSSEFGSVAGRPLLTVVTTAVPEPASLAVLGVLGLGLIRRQRRGFKS
jgi:hypothetical protein